MTVSIPPGMSLDYFSLGDLVEVENLVPGRLDNRPNTSPAVVFSSSGKIDLGRTYYLNSIGDGSPRFSAKEVDDFIKQKYRGIERKLAESND